MDIKSLVSKQTSKLHALAYERSILADRLTVIAKEMSELTGVVNVLQYVSTASCQDKSEDLSNGEIEVEDGNI